MIRNPLVKSLLISLTLAVGCGTSVWAQEDTKPQPPSEEQQQKEKVDQEKKAFTLLEQVIDEAQFLKLPENRIRVQIQAADLLWDRNQGRARSFFSQAADGVAELIRNTNTSIGNERRNFNQPRTSIQLRQELLFAVARHDAPLAYQLLAATRSLTPPPDNRTSFRPDMEENLEQALLAQIAALDPKLALQNAEQLLDKGEYPRSLPSVLSQLQRKDKEGAAKLEDKVLKRLQSANMLANVDAGSLALSLLQPGPRLSDDATNGAAISPNNQPQLLGQSGYMDLLGTVIDAAMRATPQGNNSQRVANTPRGRGNVVGGGGGQDNASSAPTDAQIEQMNARRMLNGLQVLLPQIDQYLPSRTQAVRQKMTELGIGNNPRSSLNQVFNLMQQGTTDSLMAAAQTAPPMLQPRLYQQAALKALNEGNAEKARQIASEHLDGTSRDRIFQQVEFRQITEKAGTSKLEELRQKLASLRSDDERIDLLLQLSYATRQDNPKLALQLLNDARQLTNRRATSYQQLDQQLKVSDAFRDLEPSRSFEVLEPGIAQLNDLLSAAATLSGFEVNIFRDGELPIESRNNLNGMVARYGQALGTLAKSDFDRAQTLANRFQLIEPRILTRLSIVQGLLGAQPLTSDTGLGLPNFGGNIFVRPPD